MLLLIYDINTLASPHAKHDLVPALRNMGLFSPLTYYDNYEHPCGWGTGVLPVLSVLLSQVIMGSAHLFGGTLGFQCGASPRSTLSSELCFCQKISLGRSSLQLFPSQCPKRKSRYSCTRWLGSIRGCVGPRGPGPEHLPSEGAALLGFSTKVLSITEGN